MLIMSKYLLEVSELAVEAGHSVAGATNPKSIVILQSGQPHQWKFLWWVRWHTNMACDQRFQKSV